MQVYHVNTHVLPFHPAEESSIISYPGYSWLAIDTPYLVVSQSANSYALLTSDALQACLSSAHYSCKQLMALTDRSQMTCLFALFVGDLANVKKLCNYRLSDKAPETEIKLLRGSQFLVVAPFQDIIIECTDERKRIKPAPLVIVDVPCGCRLSAGPVHVGKVLYNCDAFEGIRFGNVINDIQLMFSDLLPEREDMGAYPSLYEGDILVESPEFVDDGEFEKAIQAAGAQGVDLFNLAKRLSDHQVAWRGDQTPDIIIGSQRVSVVVAALFGATAFWLILLTTSCVVGGYYLRVIWVAVQLIKPSNGLSVFTRPPPTIAAKESYKWLWELFEIDPFVTFVNLLVLVTLVVILIKTLGFIKLYMTDKYDLCRSCFSKVYLVGSLNSDKRIYVPMPDMPMPKRCIVDTSIPMPYDMEIERVNWFLLVVNVKWHGQHLASPRRSFPPPSFTQTFPC